MAAVGEGAGGPGGQVQSTDGQQPLGGEGGFPPVDKNLPTAADDSTDSEGMPGGERDVDVVDGDGPDSYYNPAAGTYQRSPVGNRRLPRNRGQRPSALRKGDKNAPGYSKLSSCKKKSQGLRATLPYP